MLVVRRRVEYYSFASFVIGCAFDSAHAYLEYHRSAEVSWSPADRVHRWSPQGFADGHAQNLVEGVLPLWMRDARGALGANRLYAASLANAVAYICRLSQMDRNAVHQPIISSNVPDVYDVDLEAECEWELSDILPSGEIDIRSSLRVDLDVNREKWV